MKYATVFTGAAIAAAGLLGGHAAMADAKWWPAKYYNLDSGSAKVAEYTPLEKVKAAFHRRHQELYTYSEPHNAVEVVNIESTLYGHVDKPQPPRVKKGLPAAKTLTGCRKAIFAADGKLVETPVYDGSKLGAGATIKGPAIIEEVTTTIVVEPNWSARLDVSGSYVITRK